MFLPNFDVARGLALLKLMSLLFSEALHLLARVAIPLFLIAVFIYRVYFHPLSKYPGPTLGAFTQIYRHFYILCGQDSWHSIELHKKYGPVVRYGPNHLIYVSATAWRDIYGHRKEGRLANTKISFPNEYPGNESIIQARTEENHGRQRRIFSHAFSEASLREQEPMFRRYADQLVSLLRDHSARDPQRSVNIVSYLNWTTFDVMADLTFSEPLHMLDNVGYHPWVKSVFDSAKSGTILQTLNEYPGFGKLLKLVLPASLKAKRRKYFQFSEDSVNIRLEKPTQKPDIWNLVLKQKGDRILTREEMYANAGIFMLAGSETSASLLSGLTFFLAKYPHTCKRLRAELEDAFPSGENITGERLAQLPYLHACLEESLRLYPPLPISSLRIVPDGGNVIEGDWIPPGTRVGVTHQAAYTYEKYWALPFEFHPERWLPNDPDYAPFASDQRAVHQPFSTGPRNCLGRNMAYFEIRLIAALLVLNFDIELCPESAEWTNQKVYTLWEKPPLMCKVRARA